MIGALVLSAFAIAAGPEEPLWASSAPPIAGTTYRAMSWNAQAGLDCTGVIAGRPAFAGTVQYEGMMGVCLLAIPASAAGKQLRIMYGITTQVGDQFAVAHGSLPTRMIAPAPAPRTGMPFLVILHPADAELRCGGGRIDGKRVPIRYERGEGTIACLLLIPKGTAGKWLVLSRSYMVSTLLGVVGHDANGNPIYGGSAMWVDYFHGRRLLIRPAPTVRRSALVSAVPPLYKNCTSFTKKYPHGVGRANARDKTSGKPVTTFKRSTAIYNTAMKYNSRLDRDKDGVACETA